MRRRGDRGEEGRLGLLETCGEGWPGYCWYHHDESDEEVYVEDFDIVAETARHLAEGEVAVFQEVGAEKARYVTRWAAAVNHLGQKISVTIDDIYARVVEAGWPRPTPVAS